MFEVETRHYQAALACERHAFHQLLVQLEGGMEIETEARGARLQIGSLMCVPAGCEHHYCCPRADNRTLVFDIAPLAATAIALDAWFERPLAYRLEAGLAGAAGRLASAPHADRLAWLERLADTTLSPLAAPRLRLPGLIRRVEASLDTPWAVVDMARVCHLSEAAFARQFHALTGETPHAWLVRRRLARATRLLVEGGASLTAIAHACGFHDLAHFSRTFRHHHGIAPREWRRRRWHGHANDMGGRS